MAETASLAAWRRALERTAPIDAQGVIFPVLLRQLAAIHGPAPALIGEDTTLSYQALAARADHYAGWALAQGLGPGEVVALVLPNSPDYVAIWLGITRIGGIVALVNPQLRGDGLAHALASAAPKQVIVAATLVDPRLRLPTGAVLWCHGDDRAGLPRVDRPSAPPAIDRPPPSLGDTALLIYTSGTTGLPKAARVTHRRIMQWSLWFAGLMDAQPGDRLYNCLPLYHSIGGVVAIGAMLAAGAAAVIRPGFSASRFWDEVVRFDCTIFQYIGELCRYLVASPPHPRETAHRLRLCCGNGLRGDVWTAFQQRFRIPQILEFYAATEGNVSLYNCEGRPGAIGRIPPFLQHRFALELIRCDVETGEPLRGPDGFCIRCQIDEPGEAIGRIDDGRGRGHRFDGYTDAAASERKVLRDVFNEGDAWYRTGDLMRRDGEGFYIFLDRLGDTFRWKGENVATLEVEQVIAACPGVVDCVVYGVAVPGTEGRSGMAALATGPEFDLAALHRHLGAQLPDYSRPRFLRLSTAIATTGTYKPIKTALVCEGFDPGASADALYVDYGGTFVALDAELHQMIRRGEIRL